MKSRLLPLWLAFLAAVCVQLALSQTPALRNGVGSCSPVTLDLFGSTQGFSDQGILPVNFITFDGTDPPFLMVKRFNLVCESIGLTRGSASSISAIVEYERQDNQSVIFTAQVTVDCVGVSGEIPTFYPNPPSGATGTALDTTIVSTGNKLRLNPIGDFSTQVDLRCGSCVDGGVGPNVIQDTHCFPCQPECNEGQMRCTSRDTGNCCNWFLNDACVGTCPTPMVGDTMTYDCGCGPLTVPNGQANYTNRFLVGSTATYSCDTASGYVLMGGSTTMCTASGWVGSEPPCQLLDCKIGDLEQPKDGTFSYDTTTFGSVATFKCNDKFSLQGVSTRTCGLNGWSDANPTCEKLRLQCGNCNDGTCNFDTGKCVCPPQMTGSDCSVPTDKTGTTDPSVGGRGSACGTSCIIGIVLAVVGAIILVAIVVGVAFGIYSYLNHPDTKMAKYDADNINGVARDNPLYVDPEAVVGDGAEAA